MDKQITFTLISSDTPLNKRFRQDGTKENRGQMYAGKYKQIQVGTVEKLINGFSRFKENQAITLGMTEKLEGLIATNSKASGDVIARTKQYFSFAAEAFLLLDYDPSPAGFLIEMPEQYAEILREIDPALIMCDIGICYSSSYGIMKDGELISNKKSMHAYIAVENASDKKVIQYRDYLVSSAWAKGYGHIELSSSGSVMRRQVFDAAVFSPERLIFEAAPTLEAGITRLETKYYIFKGKK